MSITTANGRCEICYVLIKPLHIIGNGYYCHACGFSGIVDDSSLSYGVYYDDQIKFVRERYPQAVCHQYERPSIIYSVDNIKTKTAYEINKDFSRLVVIACGETEEEAWENAKLRVIKDEMKAIIAAEEFAAIQEQEQIERENKEALEKEYKDENGQFKSGNPGSTGFRGSSFGIWGIKGV